MIQSLAHTLGLPVEALSLACFLLLNYPITLILNRIPRNNHSLRHLCHIITTTTLYSLLFHTRDLIEIFAVSSFTFLLCLRFRKQKWCPFVVLFVTMTFLSWKHLRVFQTFQSSNKRYDNTAPIMALVIKLTSFSWSAHDAFLKSKNISQEQKERIITNYPNPLEYFGYVFYHASFMVGPAFEFRDYQRFVSNEAPYDAIPDPLVPTLTNLFTGLLLIVLYVLLGSYSYSYLLEIDSLRLRYVYLYAAGSIARIKFYIVWILAEGCCCLSGISYIGYDPRSKTHEWGRVQNISILPVEFAENAYMFEYYWNMNTRKWLRNHVYLRVVAKDNSNATAASLFTFLTSAFWHGFHVGYYLSFFSFALIKISGRYARSYLRPLFLSGSKLAGLKRVYDIAGGFVTLSFMNYCAAPFCLLSWDKSWAVWKALYFIPHIVMLGFIALINYGGLGRFLRRLSNKPGKKDN